MIIIDKIHKITKNTNKIRLGLDLEKSINITNQFYATHNIALICKSEIPIKVVKVQYACRQRTKITEAYYCNRSLPDYQGLYKGKYLCFDAKETSHKTSFALANIAQHQITYLQHVQKLQGIAFFLIHFKTKDKYFYMPIDFLTNYLANSTAKSINYNILEEKLFQISFGYAPRLDYLKIVDKFLI